MWRYSFYSIKYSFVIISIGIYFYDQLMLLDYNWRSLPFLLISTIFSAFPYPACFLSISTLDQILFQLIQNGQGLSANEVQIYKFVLVTSSPHQTDKIVWFCKENEFYPQKESNFTPKKNQILPNKTQWVWFYK